MENGLNGREKGWNRSDSSHRGKAEKVIERYCMKLSFVGKDTIKR